MNFEVDREVRVKINLTPEQIKEKYGAALQPEIEGKLYDVLSTLFNNLVGIKKIIVPGEFKSHKGNKAIKCSVRAAEGFLYPLKSSIVFIHKPVMYLRHSELKCVEFSRVGGGTAGLSRSFDIQLTKLKDDSTIQFHSIDKEEQAVLMKYFKASNIKIRTVDVDTQREVEMDSSDGDDDVKPSKEREAGKRKIKSKEVNMEEYDSESDDEDFKEDGSGAGSGDDDSGSDDESGEEDMDMIDSDVDKEELKHLQKGVDMSTDKRARRNKDK